MKIKQVLIAFLEELWKIMQTMNITQMRTFVRLRHFDFHKARIDHLIQWKQQVFLARLRKNFTQHPGNSKFQHSLITSQRKHSKKL